ncbi:MAG: tyrosinase family protein [Bacteroidota bacterium]
MPFTRNNAWNHGGTFDNPDLLWYAKGVGALQSKTLDDQNSWWFFAAIHGEYITRSVPAQYSWDTIPPPPNVPVTPLPAQSVIDEFWNQCQHQSWFFPPWHRGYLLAIEAQLRSAIIDLDGPEDWALPYWNYFGPDDQYRIPPAFTETNLPDGNPNPLYVDARYGPNNDGNVYVDTTVVSEKCQQNTIYTGSNAVTPAPGYGGSVTSFNHGQGLNGNLEANPHNLVHTEVGGGIPSRAGLMSYPGTAALDPIFYLHHCNIDRMWASWNAQGNSNPTDPNWLNGPVAVGARAFVMPMPNGTNWTFTPQDVDSLAQLDYIYEDLITAPAPVHTLAQRLNKLGALTTEALNTENMGTGTNSELVGASEGSLELGGSGLKTQLRLDSDVRKNVSDSLFKASEVDIPDLIYLQIENVTGSLDANILTVSVNNQLAAHISLFGLLDASDKDGQHGGTGLSFTIDITTIIDDLHLENKLDADSLDVSIYPNNIPEDESINVGRISIYREQQG